MQSHRGFVELLPALPKAWPSGSVKGLRARGGWTVDFAWKDGVVTECTVRASVGGKLRLKVNGRLSEYDVKPGAAVSPMGDIGLAFASCSHSCRSPALSFSDSECEP